MHTHLVFSLSFHTLIALSASGNPYSSHWHQLMDISMARWLASLMWDFLFIVFSILISTTVLYSTHSAISMACAHVLHGGWKSWSALKSMNQLRGLSSGLCMINTFVLRRWSMRRLYDYVWIMFFSNYILKDMIVCWDAWVFMSLCQITDYCFESFGS